MNLKHTERPILMTCWVIYLAGLAALMIWTYQYSVECWEFHLHACRNVKSWNEVYTVLSMATLVPALLFGFISLIIVGAMTEKEG